MVPKLISSCFISQIVGGRLNTSAVPTVIGLWEPGLGLTLRFGTQKRSTFTRCPLTLLSHVNLVPFSVVF